MKTKLTERKRKILRKIFGALSLTTALFVFQACYGPPHDVVIDIYFHGFVKSKTTNQPIQGIKVSVENQPQYEYTNNMGEFKLYTAQASEYKLKFEDIDSTHNGYFLPKDTIIKIVNESAYLQITLNDK